MKSLGLVFMVAFLLVAGTASASVIYITEANLGDYGFTTLSGTTEIVNTTSAVGTFSDLSLKMVWPVVADDAGIKLINLGDPTVSSISGFGYWVNAPLNKNSHLAMYLDTDGNGSWDTLVRDTRYNTGSGDAWLELDSSGTMSFYTKKTGFASATWGGTWSQFQAAYGTAVVKEVRISHEGYSAIGTSYLDDFSFGNTDYKFSVPEPATLVLLGLGGLFLLARRRRYKKVS